jgi:hypothetical protein
VPCVPCLPWLLIFPAATGDVDKFLDQIDESISAVPASKASACPVSSGHSGNPSTPSSLLHYEERFHELVEKKKRDNSYRYFNSVNRYGAI